MTNADLPRPADFDQAIKALTMAAGKHPKNRILPELRERADGGPLRSGDLKAFAAILTLWSAGSTTATNTNNGNAPNIDTRSNENAEDPSVETLERVRDALVGDAEGDAWVDPRQWDAALDPFTGPTPIDDEITIEVPGATVTMNAATSVTYEIIDPFTAPAPVDDTPEFEYAFETPIPEPEPPAPPATSEGADALPKGGPGAAPGTYATPQTGPGPVLNAEPFTGPRPILLHRSPSQVLSYMDCPTRYYLERIEGQSSVPAWWNIGGTAFHETIRWWETGLADGHWSTPDATARKFELVFADELAKVILANPNVSPSEYRAANKGTEGRDWWRDHGPTMAADYVTGQDGREFSVLKLAPDTLALEIGFTVNIGGIDVKGFIDQALIHNQTRAVQVRDHKTGSRLPDDPIQLQIYAIALRRIFGINAPIWGNYWRARRTARREAGETSPMLIDVDAIEPIVAWRVREMDRADAAGMYPPRPSSFCGSCGVRGLCPAMGPPESRRLDMLTR